MGYICSYCGHGSNMVYKGTCSASPSKVHEFISRCDDGYICSFCGIRACRQGFPSAKCSKSPFGFHKYIAQHSGRYTCKHCNNSNNFSGGSCSRSSHGSHEYV